MNVLMFTHEKNLNGASKSMLNLIDELKRRNVNFYVVSPFNDGPVIDELTDRGVKVFCHDCKRWMRKKPDNWKRWMGIRLKWVVYNQFYNAIEARKIKREIVDLDIDILHSNTSVINIGGIVSKMTGIPHIWYIREFAKEDFGLHYLEGEAETYRYIGRHADSIITVSNALNGKMRRFIPASKLEMIYNGVGAENIIDRKSVSKAEYSFLITGTIQPGKGQDVAVKAAKELCRRGYSNFKLYIAGRGDTAWLESAAHDCRDKIIFLGQISDMAALRKKMDVELVCSKCEAFGRVTVEAMMGAMPVIGANTGGTPELIIDGKTGLLYEQGNYKMLADKMQFFLDNPREMEKMGIEAQNYAVKAYNIKRCADDVYKTYLSVKRGV